MRVSKASALAALALGALLVIATRPLWSSASFPASYDGLLHLYRLFALDAALRQGAVYPRWLADLALGYGYPIYNYYPPLSAYVAETLHVLGASFPEAIKGTFALSIALALVGAYRMGCEFFREERTPQALGVLTSAAYVFFPFFIITVYVRGALAEALAAGIIPWLFWGLRKLLRERTLGALVLEGLFLAALVLAHGLAALVIAPLWLAYVIFEFFHLPRLLRARALMLAVSSAALGATLSAFYWLPFVAELRYVSMGQGLDLISDVFETNFLEPAKLIQLSLVYEYGGPPAPLGLAPMLMAALALVGALTAGRAFRQRSIVLFFGGIVIVCSLAVIAPARELWLLVPQATLIQAVWRVNLITNTAIALVIGALPLVGLANYARFAPQVGAADFGEKTYRGLVIGSAAAALLLMLTSNAKLNPQQVYLPAGIFTAGHLARFEISTRYLGTTTFSEYLPTDVSVPDVFDFAAPERETTRVTRARVSMLAAGPLRWRFEVETAEPLSIPLRLFAFPDWQGTIDAAPARLTSSTEMGLLTVDVPAGNHQVTVWRGETPARQFALVVSAASAFLVGAALGWMVFKRQREVWHPLLVFCLLLLVLVIPNSLALAASPRPVQPIQLRAARGVELSGLVVENARLDSNVWRLTNAADALEFRVYWFARGKPGDDQPLRWRLSRAGRSWAERAQLPRFGAALQRSWTQNELVEDRYILPLFPGMPVGRYTLELDTGDAAGLVPVAEVELERGSAPAPVEARVPNRVEATFAETIQLLGYDSPPSVRTGESLTVTTYWQGVRDILEDYTLSVQMLNPDGKLVAQRDNLTGDGLAPTSLWFPGRMNVDKRILEVPPDLSPGRYTLIAVLYRKADLERLPVMTPDGSAPDRAAVLGSIEVLSSR